MSDESPSGLAWKRSYRGKKPGDPAGSYDKTYDLYRLSFKGFRLTAHRVVYYLQTGIDPLDSDVVHERNNTSRDNRKGLRLTKAWQPKKPKKRLKNEHEQYADAHAYYVDQLCQ